MSHWSCSLTALRSKFIAFHHSHVRLKWGRWGIDHCLHWQIYSSLVNRVENLLCVNECDITCSCLQFVHLQLKLCSLSCKCTTLTGRLKVQEKAPLSGISYFLKTFFLYNQVFWCYMHFCRLTGVTYVGILLIPIIVLLQHSKLVVIRILRH